MLDIKLLRSNPEDLRDRLAIKGYALDVKEFLSLDNQRRLAQEETESLQNERNVKSKSIGQAKSKGEDVDGLIKEVGDLGDRLEKAKTTLATVRERFDSILHGIPNIPDDSVPLEIMNSGIRRSSVLGSRGNLNLNQKITSI